MPTSRVISPKPAARRIMNAPLRVAALHQDSNFGNDTCLSQLSPPRAQPNKSADLQLGLTNKAHHVVPNPNKAHVIYFAIWFLYFIYIMGTRPPDASNQAREAARFSLAVPTSAESPRSPNPGQKGLRFTCPDRKLNLPGARGSGTRDPSGSSLRRVHRRSSKPESETVEIHLVDPTALIGNLTSPVLAVQARETPAVRASAEFTEDLPKPRSETVEIHLVDPTALTGNSTSLVLNVQARKTPAVLASAKFACKRFALRYLTLQSPRQRKLELRAHPKVARRRVKSSSAKKKAQLALVLPLVDFKSESLHFSNLFLGGLVLIQTLTRLNKSRPTKGPTNTSSHTMKKGLQDHPCKSPAQTNPTLTLASSWD
ncbi:hypothetical protein O6P43_025469 [Quillaja saponaria]|uniref:Uncharacterized protein n=1 Tax=Quillaja saponaria TaxID=32244 RepID=A0AAD7PFM5_QUISA|nr:hypothetical protein O6P43_025469 [Quillaja saponaria]